MDGSRKRGRQQTRESAPRIPGRCGATAHLAGAAHPGRSSIEAGRLGRRRARHAPARRQGARADSWVGCSCRGRRGAVGLPRRSGRCACASGRLRAVEGSHVSGQRGDWLVPLDGTGEAWGAEAVL